MIEYERCGGVWKFDPLPVSRDTAKLFTAMAAVKTSQGIETMAALLEALPRAIEKSMSKHHTEDEVNAFIDTVVLDFSNPASLGVLGELNALFLGINPQAAAAEAAPDAAPQP